MFTNCQTVKNAKNSNFSSSTCYGPNLLTKTKATSLPVTLKRTSRFGGSTRPSYSSIPSNACPLRCLTCWSRGIVLWSWLIPCHVVVVQTFAFFFFCLSEIRSSRTPSWFNWMLNSFRSCCDVWMILQSNIVIFNNLLFCPPNFWQRLSILFVFVASFKCGFVSSMIGLTSFLQHVLSFAVHSLPFRRSMFGTATVILFDIIAKNWKDVVVVLVELLSSLRRF